ncbi:unnamed protein product, partial [Prunus brigantina]
VCFFNFFFLAVGPDLLNLLSHYCTAISPLIHPPSFNTFLFPYHELFNLNTFLFPRICLVVSWFVAVVHLLQPI